MVANAVALQKALAATSGKNDKQDLVAKAWLTGERDWFEAARLAYDPLITFGIKQVPDSDSNGPGLPFKTFRADAERLIKRELTGDAARDAVDALRYVATQDEWNLFYKPVLIKDLRVGLTESTINKALNKIAKSKPEALNHVIPTFSPQLAQPGYEIDEDGAQVIYWHKMKGRRLIDWKLDGVRLVCVIDPNARTVKTFTREGREKENFTTITKALETFFDVFTEPTIIDGELMSKNFQKLMTSLNRKGDVDTSDSRLAVFDWIPLAAFNAGFYDNTQADREARLLQWVQDGHIGAAGTDAVLWHIEKEAVDLDTEEGRARFDKINRDALHAGFEGIMIKDPSAGYTTKRVDAWLKIKPFISVDLTVVGIEEGEKGKKFEGSLGALICESIDGNRKIRVKVGSGYAEELRAQIWANPDKVVGQVVEVFADAFTQNRNEPNVWSLRFPRFGRFRSIEAGEKF